MGFGVLESGYQLITIYFAYEAGIASYCLIIYNATERYIYKAEEVRGLR